jgi:penicillin-binding protein 1B
VRVLAIALLPILAIAVALFVRFGAQVHALRERRASTPGWSFPSRLYSGGVPLTIGRPLPSGYLLEHLELRGYQRAASPVSRPGTYAPVPGGFEIVLRGFLGTGDPAGSGGPERVRVALRNGRLANVQRFRGPEGATPPDLAHPPRLEPVLIGRLTDEKRTRREWVPLARIPKTVRDAVIAAEDRRFYRHPGFDVRSNVRALVTDLRSRGLREGASTITQQLARALFLHRRRTLGRKLSELTLAAGLELLLSKDQILEMYLNSVYWGQDDGDAIGGVAEAARHYFAAPVESLGVGEAALLAGIIPAPNAYSPFRSARLARARRNAVLDDMVAAGLLDSTRARQLARTPLGARRGEPVEDRFPSFTGYVREFVESRLPREVAERRGLSIFTSLDPVWQLEAQERLAAGVDQLERWQGRSPEPLEGAFVAVEPATGFVRAMVGSRNPRTGDFNRAFQARRQPGSAIKPLVYAAALDPPRGDPRFTPASVVPDLRREFQTPEGPWKPRNDEGDYHPTVTLAKALAKSLNVATANLVEAIGPSQVTRYAERFGLGKIKAVASVGLGTNEVTLVGLTSAYGTFVNGGVRRDATPVRAVSDARGRVILEPPRHGSRVLTEPTAALMTGLLEDVVTFGVSYPLKKVHGFLRPVAGKTGTTNDYHDAWFVAFTPDVVAGVWVGFDAPRSLMRPAAELALPLWADIMKRLLLGFPATAFRERPDIELQWIDSWSGGLARSDCPSKMRVPFVRGTAPAKLCARDHAADWEALFQARAADSVRAVGDSLASAGADSTGRWSRGGRSD